MHEILHGQSYTPCKTQTALDAFLDEFGYPDFGSPLLEADSSGEWVVERYRHVSLDDLVAQEIEAFCSIAAALENMQEDVLRQHNLYHRIPQHTYERYRESAHPIRRWLKGNGTQSK
jgi:hypothetical protein